MAVALEEKLTEQFEDRGYVILGGFLDGDIVEGVKAEIDKLVDFHAKILLSQRRISDAFKSEPFETRMARLYEDHLDLAPKNFRHELHLPGFFDLFFDPKLLDVVESILGPEIRLYPNYTVRPKLPDWEGARVLWHQDGGYTDAEGVDLLSMVNVWTPLVPATVENGCMQFVPGTHKLGSVAHEQREIYLKLVPEELDPRVGDAVTIEMAPGDVVLFNNLLFHQGMPNRSKTIRWSVDWRYQNATESTLRPFEGHKARSRSNPASEVKSREEWSALVSR